MQLQFTRARASCSVPSLASERRWMARRSLFGLCDRCASRMRAGRAARPVVEHHQLFRFGSERSALVNVCGTPPPSGEDALRLSPVSHSLCSHPSHELRLPPSLAKKSERGDVGGGAISYHEESFVRKELEAPSDAISLFLISSLAFFCERRWMARWSLFGLCDRCASRMRAGRAARPVVEHHRPSRVGSGRSALVNVCGTPPPSGEDALRLSPVSHSLCSQPSHELRLPPSLGERGDKAVGAISYPPSLKGRGWGLGLLSATEVA